MKPPIYLDHHATTPVDPQVLEAMLPYFNRFFGNSASRNHKFGWEAEEAVEIARGQIATAIGAEKSEILFTSGATEANNLALKGISEQYLRKGNHIVTSAAEHSCVLDTCRYLETQGFEVTYLPVDAHCQIDIADVKEAITPKTILVSLMMANNEVGVINPLKSIGEICRERQVLFHSDMAQALGKIEIDVNNLNVDIASFSGHKFYAPKGIGALYVRGKKPRVKLMPQIHGGGHENGMRAGTLNVPGIVGMGKAAEMAGKNLTKYQAHYLLLQKQLFEGLVRATDGVRLNGPAPGITDRGELKRLPNNLNVSFAGVDGEGLIMALKDIAVSTGSACSTALPEPSHVLTAMGVSRNLAKASLRFGIGQDNTMEEINYVVKEIGKAIKLLQGVA